MATTRFHDHVRKMMERDQQKKIVEALVLASREPISASRIAEIVPRGTPSRVKELIKELELEYQRQDRAFELWEVGGGYQIRTRPEYAGYVRQLQREHTFRLSRAALETLAVVAYKQPVTRAEIENVRGVDVGAVIRSLVERKLVRIAGHREVPGRPLLYATTKRFLEVFGFSRLEDLPTLREIDELVLPGIGGDAGTEETALGPAAADGSLDPSSEAPPPESVEASGEDEGERGELH
jgi:segregation and condensation protein B